MKKRCAAFIAAMTLLTACSPVPKQELSTPSLPPSSQAAIQGDAENAPASNTTMPDSFGYKEIPGFPIGDDLPSKIVFTQELIPATFAIEDAGQILEVMEILEEVEVYDDPADSTTDREITHTIAFYSELEDAAPSYVLSFDVTSLSIEAGGTHSKAYPTNWEGNNPDGLWFKLVQKVLSWQWPSDPFDEARITHFFMTYYRPSLLSLPNPLSEDMQILPEQAYECFQYYTIAHYVSDEKRAKIQTKSGDISYYPQEIVEAFVYEHFDMPAEAIRTVEAYVESERGFAETIFGGVDKNTVDITGISQKDDVYLVSFHYTNHDGDDLIGELGLRQEDSRLLLVSLQMGTEIEGLVDGSSMVGSIK